MHTLWDLIGLARRRPPAPTPKDRPSNGLADRPANQAKAAPRPGRTGSATSAADRYEALTRMMLARYGIRVRKWRTSTSGVAWQVVYADGRVARLIESPRPRGPISAAVFLHEVGHHAIGLGTYRPRCLEEYHAWLFALQQMHAHGVRITPRVHERIDAALRYAVAKARRRGLRALPAELAPYDGPGPVTPIDYLGHRPASAGSGGPPTD
ncbi:MAG: hypothetical protein KatS3mg103_0975 [Phycisphaerales bacterium]|nr:MAG: hypothetical protein KatS3mg103_0975 [Phycisphaerales bacterium]